MLPHSDHGPTVLGKPAVRLLVPLLVSRELLPPPVGVRARKRRMLRARVPEAAVDEHDDLRPREDDVGAASSIELERLLNAEAISTPMQGGSKRELRRRMRSSRPAHPVAHLGDDGAGRNELRCSLDGISAILPRRPVHDGTGTGGHRRRRGERCRPMASLKEGAERLRRAAGQLRELADRLEDGAADRDDFDPIVAEILGTQRDHFGPRPRAPRGHGAKVKILAYLQTHVGKPVHGEELGAISGIQEWARRVRELRVEDGYEIVELGQSTYQLESLVPDRERALQWQTANEIRRRRGSARSRIEAFLEANVGQVVTRQQIDYVSNIAEGSRRVRELRDEAGWPINSHIDEPDLEPGEYRLLSTDPRTDAKRHRGSTRGSAPPSVRARQFTCQDVRPRTEKLRSQPATRGSISRCITRSRSPTTWRPSHSPSATTSRTS